MTEPSQEDKYLRIYLNEHLAGAVSGVELTEHLIARSTGDQQRRLQDLLGQIEEDRETLRDVLRRTGGSPNSLKKATSWLGEKLSELKFDRERSKYQEQAHVKELEALALGISGKRSLWTLFEEVFDEDNRFEDIDFQQLKSRAEEQYGEVDRLRLEAARKAFDRK